MVTDFGCVVAAAEARGDGVRGGHSRLSAEFP